MVLVCSGHLSNSPAHGCGTVETPPVLSQDSVSDGPLEGDVPVGKCPQSLWSFSSSLGRGTWGGVPYTFLGSCFPSGHNFQDSQVKLL